MTIQLLNLFDVLGSAIFSIPALIILVLDIIVLRSIWRNESRSEVNKLLWTLVVFFFPLGGVIIFWLFGD